MKFNNGGDPGRNNLTFLNHIIRVHLKFFQGALTPNFKTTGLSGICIPKMEAIGTLAGGIAHDFNNILSIILGYSEMALLNLQSEKEDPQKDIRQVITAGIRASELVKQILTFSRTTEKTAQQLSPHLIVKEALQMLRASLPTTIDMKLDIDAECGDILADPTKIHQIVVNLCTNALHAMTDEKGTLSVSLCRMELDKE